MNMISDMNRPVAASNLAIIIIIILIYFIFLFRNDNLKKITKKKKICNVYLKNREKKKKKKRIIKTKNKRISLTKKMIHISKVHLFYYSLSSSSALLPLFPLSLEA